MVCIAAEWVTDMRIWAAAGSAFGTLVVFVLILIGQARQRRADKLAQNTPHPGPTPARLVATKPYLKVCGVGMLLMLAGIGCFVLLAIGSPDELPPVGLLGLAGLPFLGGIVVCLAPMIALSRRRAVDMCPGCQKKAMQFLKQDRGLTLTCPRCGHEWVAGTNPARPI